MDTLLKSIKSKTLVLIFLLLCIIRSDSDLAYSQSNLTTNFNSVAIRQSNGDREYQDSKDILTTTKTSHHPHEKGDIVEMLYWNISGNFTFNTSILDTTGRCLAGVVVRADANEKSLIVYIGKYISVLILSSHSLEAHFGTKKGPNELFL